MNEKTMSLQNGSKPVDKPQQDRFLRFAASRGIDRKVDPERYYATRVLFTCLEQGTISIQDTLDLTAKALKDCNYAV